MRHCVSIVMYLTSLQKQEIETISLDSHKGDKQMTALPSLDIPKELWKLVDYLFSYGLDKVI